MECLWIVDDIMLEKYDNVGFPTINNAVLENGFELITTKYVPLTDSISVRLQEAISYYTHNKNIPVIVYGSIQFCNQFERYNSWAKYCPGVYNKKENFLYSTYSAYYSKWMFNQDYTILPYNEVRNRTIVGDKIFIRSNSGQKTVPGRVYDTSQIQDQFEQIEQYQKISKEELVVIVQDKSNEIKGEYRHVVCDGEVVAQSQYRWEGKLDIRTDIWPECQSLAKYIAREGEFQPDYVYVIDTCVDYNDNVMIMEFNSFSCSGLYACDTNMIVKRVSDMAIKEFNGDI